MEQVIEKETKKQVITPATWMSKAPKGVFTTLMREGVTYDYETLYKAMVDTLNHVKGILNKENIKHDVFFVLDTKYYDNVSKYIETQVTIPSFIIYNKEAQDLAEEIDLFSATHMESTRDLSGVGSLPVYVYMCDLDQDTKNQLSDLTESIHIVYETYF